MNSFNSSMNFAKLQNSINFRQSTYGSERNQNKYGKTKNLNESTIQWDQTNIVRESSQMPNPVKEVSMEDE